jgi:RNA polymerase sigma-70 factor, ECF subfamily
LIADWIDWGHGQERQESPVTDSELAQRCARGDRQAQRLLYDHCSDRVYRVLCRMMGNQDDALDLAQDTFVRVFQKIHTFDGASGLMTWVYRIAVNEALQFRRRQKRTTTILGRVAWNRREVTPGAPDKDARRDLLEALALLPEAERALLVLRYVEGLAYNQMAEVLGKPPGTIASGLNRARQMLRQVLCPDNQKKGRCTSIKQDGRLRCVPLPETRDVPTGRTVTEGRTEL